MPIVRWYWACFCTIFVVLITDFIYQNYFFYNSLNTYFSIEFKIIYLLLLITSTLIIFLKPKQEEYDVSELRNKHLLEKTNEQRFKIEKTIGLKNEFLRNIPHESHTPITSIASFSHMLKDNYNTLSKKEKLKMISHIASASTNLLSFIDNIFNLSKLSNTEYKINKENFNLSILLHQEIEKCKKLYLTDDEEYNRNFYINIEDNIEVNADKYYMSQVFDNLIINAISYCKEGNIYINLYSKKEQVFFEIKDEGIGIPIDELQDIFNPFVVSSKTRSKSGGRGIGLALSKKVIELHNGSISSHNNHDNNGSTFSFYILK